MNFTRPSVQSHLTRRAALKTIAAAGLVAAWPGKLSAQTGEAGAAWRSVVLKYLARLARADGGYAWEDQEASHLTPTWAVIGCHRILETMPPNKSALAEFVRTHHPAQLKKLEQEHREFEFQQIQSLVWLDEDVASFQDLVRTWTRPTTYLKQYEQHGHPILRHEITAFTCRELLGLPLDDLPSYTSYLDSRRRANGSFNNSPAFDGSDGHVLNTWWGLQGLRALKRADEKSRETIAWLRSCQLPNGAFNCAPRPEFGGWDDVAYTWAAVKSLKLLGAAPADRAGCIAYLRSLWNADGGFSDRPGWQSNPLATFHALAALAALGSLDSLSDALRRPSRAATRLPDGLRVFSAQIEAHGTGSPAEAVDLAGALRIHLWGAKNAKPGWLALAQQIADQRRVPVRFFASDEEYGTWVDVPGLGTYSHISDVIAPAGASFGPSLAKQGAVSWPEFRARRMEALTKAGGRLIWQFGENEELVRLFLDDSLQRGGYAAISTFHFGNPDFTNSESFLQRWRGQIPFVALQDAHGPEPWWFADMTTGFRTLFLASEPTWEGWLQALEHNWVAAVRHDAASGFKTWMHGGSPEVMEFIRRHEEDWRWWDHPQARRPLVSIVALRPEDVHEAGKPDTGVAIRVRCAWENTAQGLLKKPLTELVRLTIDGVTVTPKLVRSKAPRGQALAEHCHLHHLPTPGPGRHTAVAVVKELATGRELTRSLEF